MSTQARLIIVLIAWAAGAASYTRGSDLAMRWWLFATTQSVSLFTSLLVVDVVLVDRGLKVYAGPDWLFAGVLLLLLVGVARCGPPR